MSRIIEPKDGGMCCPICDMHVLMFRASRTNNLVRGRRWNDDNYWGAENCDTLECEEE